MVIKVPPMRNNNDDLKMLMMILYPLSLGAPQARWCASQSMMTHASIRNPPKKIIQPNAFQNIEKKLKKKSKSSHITKQKYHRYNTKSNFTPCPFFSKMSR